MKKYAFPYTIHDFYGNEETGFFEQEISDGQEQLMIEALKEDESFMSCEFLTNLRAVLWAVTDEKVITPIKCRMVSDYMDLYGIKMADALEMFDEECPYAYDMIIRLNYPVELTVKYGSAEERGLLEQKENQKNTISKLTDEALGGNEKAYTELVSVYKRVNVHKAMDWQEKYLLFLEKTPGLQENAGRLLEAAQLLLALSGNNYEMAEKACLRINRYASIILDEGPSESAMLAMVESYSRLGATYIKFEKAKKYLEPCTEKPWKAIVNRKRYGYIDESEDYLNKSKTCYKKSIDINKQIFKDFNKTESLLDAIETCSVVISFCPDNSLSKEELEFSDIALAISEILPRDHENADLFKSIANRLSGIGEDLYDFSERDRAVPFFKKAVEIEESLNEEAGRTEMPFKDTILDRACWYLGNIYETKGRLLIEESKAYFRKSFDYR